MARSNRSRITVKAAAVLSAAGVAAGAAAAPALAASGPIDGNGNLYAKNGDCFAKVESTYFPPQVIAINNPITQAPEYLIRTWGKGYCQTKGEFSAVTVAIQEQQPDGSWKLVAGQGGGTNSQDAFIGVGYVISNAAPCRAYRAETLTYRAAQPNRPYVTVISDASLAGKC